MKTLETQIDQIAELRKKWLSGKLIEGEKIRVSGNTGQVIFEIKRKENTTYLTADIGGSSREFYYLGFLADIAELCGGKSIKIKYNFSENTEKLEKIIQSIENIDYDLLSEITGVEDKGKIKSSIEKLRNIIDKMKWFSIGPNSYGLEKSGDSWVQISFSPASYQDEEELTNLFESLKIFPFPETIENVRTLTIENYRDIQILREMMIIAYAVNRNEIQKLKEDSYQEGYEVKYKQSDVSRFIARIDRMISYKAKRTVEDAASAFPYPYIDKSRNDINPRLRREMEDMSVYVGEDEDADMAGDIHEIISNFDQGLTEEDFKDIDIFASKYPNLKLFTRKYKTEGSGVNRKWKNLKTGESIDYSKFIEIIMKAKNWQENEASKRALDEIVLMQFPQIAYIVKRVAEKTGYRDVDDLFQEGFLGLARAVELFIPNSGATFAHYASLHIESKMRKYFANNKSAIRIPIHKQQEQYKISLFVEKFKKEHGSMPGESEVASGMDWPLERVRDHLRSSGKIYESDLSIFENTDIVKRDSYLYSIDKGEHSDTMNAYEGDIYGELTEEIVQKDLKELIARTLLTLSPREERIIRLRFGIDINNTHENNSNVMGEFTLEEIGKMFGVSRERIRVREWQALRKLRNIYRSKKLSSFLEN